MAKKRYSANDFKVVDATAVSDGFEYTEIYTPGSSTGSSSFGVTTPSTNVAGMQNVIPVGVYNATPTTRTEGQAGPLQADTAGNLNNNLGTRLAGENITKDVLYTRYRGASAYISTAATTQVKTGSGHLGRVLLTGGTMGTVTIYDNTAASGTIIASFDSTMPLASYPIDAEFSIGCCVVTSAAQKVTVIFDN